MKKYLALALAVLMIVATFAGCGKAVDKNDNVVNGTFTEYLVAEKVGTLNRDDFMVAEGGVYYEEKDVGCGIMSFNGAIDSGAIYSYIKPVGKYFQVRKTQISSENDIMGINASTLVDCKGRVIADGFAVYEVLNERYVKVGKASKVTYAEDDALVAMSQSGDTYFGSVGNCTWYEGVWSVYDVTTGKAVPGATGTKNKFTGAKGRYVEFYTDDDTRLSVNENGEALPEGAKLFDDGSYAVEGKIGEVFDANGNSLFNYDLTGFIPQDMEGEYYIASKYVDGTSKRAVMDKKGQVISAEFDTYFSIYGELIHCNDTVYNFKGEVVLAGTYESVYFDKMFGQNWMLRMGDYYTVIDKNGAVFFNGPDDDDHTVFTSEFVACKKIDDKNYYYSYKDQDYTIPGYSFAPWLVKTPNNNSMYDLVDVMTGKKLLEGYSDFSSISRNSLAYYVYAKYNGGADVYLVVSGAQLEDVINKKNNLFDDLAAAFAAEGIQVTVNKETGEIALDSSVLFGGDSAELTADGKTFLNKFVKAYVAVAFSEKYEDFISKTMVEGHTAPVQGSTYASGLKLSEERATNVKNYCLSADTGVDVSKLNNALEAVGYSNSKPVYGADGAVNMAASRRVSFRFMVNVDF